MILIRNRSCLTLRRFNSLVLFDKDGTLVEDKGYVHKVEDFVWHENGLRLLKLASQENARIYVVTNQSGISKGLFTRGESISFSRHLILEARNLEICIKAVVMCPHEEQSVNCKCRKPGTGMYALVKRLARTRTSKTVMIGNSDVDEQFANNLKGVYIDVNSQDAQDQLLRFLRS
jgi:D-glycero-D-manno-heptose 1,7-bisphosphate phosphatase